MLIQTRDFIGSVLRLLPEDFPGRGSVWRRVYPLTLEHCDRRSDRDFERLVRLRDGSRLLLDLRDRTVQEAFYTGRYDRSTTRLLKQVLSEQSRPVFIDVGANIGLISVPIANWLRARAGSAHCFEPFPGNFLALQNNCQLNRLDNVTLHPWGLGAHEQTVYLSVGGEEHAPAGVKTGNAAIVIGSGVARADTDYRTTKITVRRLDDVCKQFAIDRCTAIKVDIEGYELYFLQGAMEFLARCRPTIVGEFNADWLRHFGYTMKEVYTLLKPLGYRVYQLSGSRLIPVLDEPLYLENAVFKAM